MALFVASCFVVTSRLCSSGTFESVWLKVACSHARLCCDLIGFHKPRLGQVRIMWTARLPAGHWEHTQQNPDVDADSVSSGWLRCHIYCGGHDIKEDFWTALAGRISQGGFGLWCCFFFLPPSKSTDVNSSVLALCKSFNSPSGLHCNSAEYYILWSSFTYTIAWCYLSSEHPTAVQALHFCVGWNSCELFSTFLIHRSMRWVGLEEII